MKMRGVTDRLFRSRGNEGPPRFYVREALAALRGMLFRGDRVECGCCGRSFSQFLYSPHLTAPCPYCMSSERYRLLCRFLREQTDFGARPMRVLDIGPLWCFQEFCRSFPGVEYVSADIKSPLAMHHTDIKDLAFPDESFDCIICYHVLEHIDDDRRALEELRRVLKPDGWAIIQVPIHIEKTTASEDLSQEMWDKYIRWDDHLRAYGKDFPELLESAGFRVHVNSFVKSFSEEELERYGLDKTEDIYLCVK